MTLSAAALIPLPVLIPLLASATTLILGRRPRAQRFVTVSALTGSLIVTGLLLFLADRDGIAVLQVGGWEAPMGISLVVDRLAALMLVVSGGIVLLAVMLFAVGQGIHDGNEQQPVSIFLPTYLALTAGVNIAFLAGDLFNLFVGFEVLLAASFVLLTLGGASADRVRAGVSYVMVSMVSSLVFLIGMAFAYAATGTLNLAHMAVRMDDVPPASAPRSSGGCCSSRSASRPRSSRCRPGCLTRIRPRRPPRSPRCSRACSRRSVCTPSSGRTRCSSRAANSTTCC